MNKELEEKIRKSEIGSNRYFLEIVKGFITSYPKDSTRVIINDDNINTKIKDLSGAKILNFKIIDDKLQIKIDKTVNFMKYQDIIIYDNYGIMMERSHCQASLKKDINEKFGNNQEVLIQEFDKLGQVPSIYTGSIFEQIDLTKIRRDANFGLDGMYSRKQLQYDERGEMLGKVVSGTFKVFNSGSISTLEFPKEEEITILKEEVLDDKDIYESPLEHFKK